MKRKEEPLKYCLNCGTLLERKTYNERLEDYGVFMKRKYCCLSCANSRKRPKHWSTYHWRARKFLKGFCESCGYTKKLQAHHIDQNPENNTQENVQTLCKHCHDFWHTAAKRMGKTPAGAMPKLF